MPCCVPRCVPDSAGRRKLVRFPMDMRLRKRWMEVIKLGTGVELLEPVRSLDRQEDQPMELCLGHFERPEEIDRYQEPARFVDGSGTPQTFLGCRLCLQFVPASETITTEDSVSCGVQLGGLNLPSAIQRTLGIRIQRDDCLRTVCLICLAKLELVLAVRNQYRINEYVYETVRTAGGERLEVIAEGDDDGEDVKQFFEELEIFDYGEDYRDDEGGDKAVDAEPVQKEKKRKKAGEKKTEMKKVKVEKANFEGDEDHQDDEGADESIEYEPVQKEKKRKKESGEKKTEMKKVKVEKPIKVNIKEMVAKTCFICKRPPFANKEELDLHLTREHITKDSHYTCAICNDGEKMLLVQSYNLHLSYHDESIRRFKCRFCPMIFSMKKSLRLHENKKHDQSHDITERNVTCRESTCDICGKNFSSVRNLQRHKDTVHSVNKRFTCKICDKKLTTRASLLQHMVSHSGKQHFYECDLCDKKFKFISQVAGHKVKAHATVMNDYLCVVCQKRYTSMPEYETHMREYHVNCESYEFSCRLCPIVPQTDEELQQHIAQSHADKKYPYFKCIVCPQKFHTKNQLLQHRREGHGRFVCDQCGGYFANKNSLKAHVNGVHLGLKRYKDLIECPDCEFRCTYYPNLRRHQKVVHLGERLFECSYCHKKFGTKSVMENHVRNIHTGEMPFGCRHCGMRFKETSTYSRHQKKCGETKAPSFD